MKTIVSIAAAFACIGAGSAHAHATFANAPVQPEATVAAVLQVPHGCDGKATTEVQVILPEGFISAKPQPKAGWELEVIKGDYQKVYEDHGKKVTAGPLEIRWKNGNLPDEFYDTFTVRGKVTGIEAGGALPFKVTQLCGTDGTVVWNEVAGPGVDPHSLKSPAPLLKVAVADDAVMGQMQGHGAMHGQGMGQGHMGQGHMAQGQPMQGHQMMGHGAMDGSGMAGANPDTMEAVKLGELELTAGFTKAMLPGQPVGGGFITIRNGGASDDRLIEAKSPVSGRVELHEMAMVNDVMKMRQLNDGIPVPAGQTVELKPGGLHLMFMDVKEPFVEGGKVTVTLTFEKAGSVDVVLPIGPVRGK